jgi:hypothetical protein
MQPPKESEEGILKHPVWEGVSFTLYPTFTRGELAEGPKEKL